MALWSGSPEDSATLDAMGVDALETSPGQVLAAQFGSAFAANPASRIARAMASPGPIPEARAYWEQYRDPAGRNQTDDMAQIAAERGDEPAVLDPEDANRRFGIKGALRFDKPVSEAVARDLYDSKRAAIARQDIIDRRADSLLTGWMARSATSLAAGVLDPINIGAGFIPIVGEGRAAAWLAAAGSPLARTAVRAGIGALQGAGSMAALEPLNLALDAREHDDWTMSQALADIAFGGLIGGGLHVVTGHPRNPLTREIEAAGPDARIAALQAGIAQHLDGGPVNVAPVLDTAQLGSAYAARLAARGETAAGSYAAYTPEGLRVELRPEVVELSSLVASHDEAGHVNPDFPHAAGMQPRDRSSAASQAQITEMASRLEPERLGPSPEAGAGAPIVNAANVVESGNGRTLALRRVYSEPGLADQASAYRAFLTASGFDVEGMAQPVLIGRRITDLAPDQAQAFVRGANERATLGMNAAEQAQLDAARAGKAIDDFQPGPLDGRTNQRFIAAFMAQVPAEERAGMLLGNGNLSTQGEARIRAALLAHAYGDALGPTLERMLNGDVENMKAIANTLTDLAGAWSQMRQAARRGDIPAGLDITPAIGEAVQILDRARAAGIPLADMLAQSDAFSQPSPAALGLLRLMFRDDAMRQPVGRQKLTELLDRYVQQAMAAHAGPGLFGEPETTAADILRAIGGDDAKLQAVADALAEAGGPGAAELPEDVAASRAVTAAVEQTPPPTPSADLLAAAPEAPGTDHAPAPPERQIAANALSPDLAELQRLADEASRSAQAELAAGRLTETDMAQLRQADAVLAKAEGTARAYEAAATCLIGTAS